MTAMKCTALLTFLTIVMTSRSHGMKVVNTYRDVFGDNLLSMDIANSSGTIVISSVNSVTKLNETLHVTETRLMETIVNNIVIDSKLNSVILCSVESGRCEICSLNDINKVLFSNPNRLVPKQSNSNSVLLLISKQKRIFFANNFLSAEMQQDLSVPILSSRTINDLHLVHSDAKGTSAKYVRDHGLPSAFFVMYLYAFSEGKYVYFLSRQPNSQNSAVTSKISRLCLGDENFRSYIEIQLDCVADASTQFSLAQSAHYDPGTKKLVVAFTKGGNVGQRSRNMDSSAVCSFMLQDIDKMMDNTVHDCLQGNGLFGPIHLHKNSSCVPTVRRSIRPFLENSLFGITRSRKFVVGR